MKNKLIALTLAGTIIMGSSSCFVLVRSKHPRRHGHVVIVSQKNDAQADSLIQSESAWLPQPLKDEASAQVNKK